MYAISRISMPPSPPPEAASPSYSVGSPNKVTVFNVRSFGAIGDGVRDETQAFKMAWDTACQEEEQAIILVPRSFTFMIQSTIFTGPCRSSNLTFQVIFLAPSI